MPSTEEILVERAYLDHEEGLAHARKRLRETHGRIVGATLDALLMGAVSALHVRTRMREDVRALIALAQRVNAGEDARKLAEAHLDEVLRLKSKMHLLAREDDPAFQHIRHLALELFARRLPDLARMVAVKDAVDYDDIVRRAFPDRAHVDALVEDNAATVRAMIEHLVRNPQVLHMPRAFAPKMAEMAREFIEWKVGEVRRGVDIIYASSR